MHFDTPDVFRPRFNRVLSIATWLVLTGLAAGVAVASALAGSSPWLMPVFGAGALLTWVFLWRPHLAVDAEGVTIANIAHIVTVPWAELIHVDVAYSLRVHVPGKAYPVSAAPAPGRVMAAVAHRGAVAPDSRVGGTVPVGELLTTDSGKAAQLIRSRWNALRDAGLIPAGEADGASVTTRIDSVAVTALVASAALIALSALLAG